MARQIPDPIIARPPGRPNLEQLFRFAAGQTRSLVTVLREIVTRANGCLPVDGTEGMEGPLVLETYTVSTLPTASDYTQGLIYVSDETGGATVAFSDGTNWRRVQDRAIVS